MRFILYIFLIVPISLQAQKTLALGNTTSVCFKSDAIESKDFLPNSLEQYKAIIIFSNVNSALSNDDAKRILSFVKNGGGLYIGAENWPMQAEGKQLTELIYNKSHFGNYQAQVAEKSDQENNLSLKEIDSIPSGTTIAAFPLDYRLKVEVWVEDQPLILSGNIGRGKVIIDGGYSRFYCNQRNKYSDQLFTEILKFLMK